VRKKDLEYSANISDSKETTAVAHPLVILNDIKTVTGHHTVVEDFTTHFALCRFGIWVGCETDFIETVKCPTNTTPTLSMSGGP